MGLHEEGGPPPGDGRTQPNARAMGDESRYGYGREQSSLAYAQGQQGSQQQYQQQMRMHNVQGMSNRPPPTGPTQAPQRKDSNPQERGKPQDREHPQQMRMNNGQGMNNRPPVAPGPQQGRQRKDSNPLDRGNGNGPNREHQQQMRVNNGGEMSSRSPASSHPPPGPLSGPERKGSNPQEAGNPQARDPSRTRTNRKGSAQIRLCKKCGEPLTGQFVRALGGTFHLDCFKCRDCGQIVASKFFPVDEENGESQYPLCETDYFRRLELLCHKCGGALRGSYITALDNKYHIDHFTCSVCPTIFGAQDSYYEHESQVYCHYHYSTQFAQRCYGCQTAILKQFVEIFRNGQNQHWHPECYMIHKFWNVRLAEVSDVHVERPTLSEASDEAARNVVRDEEERMEEKVYRIWSVLSTFEESSAANISDMLLNVSNGAYAEGVLTAKKFLWHVDLLFKSADKLDEVMLNDRVKGLSYSREAKLLCKKIVAFFALLSKTHEAGVRKLGVTQELLSLVTGLAHYLKLLIRICLQGSLRVEREVNNTEGLDVFLKDLSGIELIKDTEKSLDDEATIGLAETSSDQCTLCRLPVEDESARYGDKRWHLACTVCSICSTELGKQLDEARWSEREKAVCCSRCEVDISDASPGFVRVSRLQQYMFLLKVALARLLIMFRKSSTLPHTSDSPNLNGYNSQDGHRVPESGANAAVLRADSRSKSHGGNVDDYPADSSYENTLNDVRRLRSTRMDKHLSSTIKKARTSRIMDGPESQSTRPGSAGGERLSQKGNDLKIIEDSDSKGDSKSELFFGHQDALTLDDIPRIVAAQQTKEQRPNAYRHARHELFRTSLTEPKLLNGHNRTFSGANELEHLTLVEEPVTRSTGKRYFSELSALEYFIVRHVAVLSMQPMLEGQFTLEELLGLIESRKPTFWNKFGKAFKNDGRKTTKKRGVFGIPLDQIIDKDGADSTDGVGPGSLKIPAIVDDCISVMRKMDLSVEGVFRKNGNIKRLNDAVATIDKDGCDALDLSSENVVQVAALLKKYLRELPDPLLTFKLHRLWLTSQKITEEDTRRRLLHLTCCLLPKAHRDCLEILCSFLKWAASFHAVDEESGSKMDIHNLATVMAPNLLFSKSTMPGMDESFLAIETVHSLIEFNDQFCEVPEDLLSILNDTSLFSNPSDITTKEILKRYGDLAANGGARHQVETTYGPARSKDGSGRAEHSPVVRVDTDPSQETARQTEASVRHIQENSLQPAGSSNQNSPPQNQWQGDELDHISPYSHSGYPSREGLPQFPGRDGNGTPDSRKDNGGVPNNYRNSGWGGQARQQNGGVLPMPPRKDSK